jgi:hypothetical protein
MEKTESRKPRDYSRVKKKVIVKDIDYIINDTEINEYELKLYVYNEGQIDTYTDGQITYTTVYSNVKATDEQKKTFLYQMKIHQICTDLVKRGEKFYGVEKNKEKNEYFHFDYMAKIPSIKDVTFFSKHNFFQIRYEFGSAYAITLEEFIRTKFSEGYNIEASRQLCYILFKVIELLKYLKKKLQFLHRKLTPRNICIVKKENLVTNCGDPLYDVYLVGFENCFIKTGKIIIPSSNSHDIFIKDNRTLFSNLYIFKHDMFPRFDMIYLIYNIFKQVGCQFGLRKGVIDFLEIDNDSYDNKKYRKRLAKKRCDYEYDDENEESGIENEKHREERVIKRYDTYRSDHTMRKDENGLLYCDKNIPYELKWFLGEILRSTKIKFDFTKDDYDNIAIKSEIHGGELKEFDIKVPGLRKNPNTKRMEYNGVMDVVINNKQNKLVGTQKVDRDELTSFDTVQKMIKKVMYILCFHGENTNNLSPIQPIVSGKGRKGRKYNDNVNNGNAQVATFLLNDYSHGFDNDENNVNEPLTNVLQINNNDDNVDKIVQKTTPKYEDVKNLYEHFKNNKLRGRNANSDFRNHKELIKKFIEKYKTKSRESENYKTSLNTYFTILKGIYFKQTNVQYEDNNNLIGIPLLDNVQDDNDHSLENVVQSSTPSKTNSPQPNVTKNDVLNKQNTPESVKKIKEKINSIKELSEEIPAVFIGINVYIKIQEENPEKPGNYIFDYLNYNKEMKDDYNNYLDNIFKYMKWVKNETLQYVKSSLFESIKSGNSYSLGNIITRIDTNQTNTPVTETIYREKENNSNSNKSNKSNSNKTNSNKSNSNKSNSNKSNSNKSKKIEYEDRT